jgi:hypothetical protein
MLKELLVIIFWKPLNWNARIGTLIKLLANFLLIALLPLLHTDAPPG